MKNILFITMLLGVGYSQCNETNWQEYYPDMQGCFLIGADLSGANLSGVDSWLTIFVYANLENTIFTNNNLIYTYLDETGDCIEGNGWLDDHIPCNSDNDCPANSFCSNMNIGDGTCSPVSCDGYDDASYDAGAESGDPCYGVVCDDDPEMICICGECTYEDEQGDTGGGDCSYGDECFDAGAESGDLNLDETTNVLDAVMLIDVILSP